MAKHMHEKSRKEKRKEARLEKKRKIIESRIKHQKSSKPKRSYDDLKPKTERGLKNALSQVVEEAQFVHTDANGVNDRNVKQHSVPMDSTLKLDLPGCTKFNASKVVKRKKTKFEEYLVMDEPKCFLSAEEDLKFERKLAKKLKVEKGNLRGDDDGINMLFEGLPSALDSFEEDAISDAEEVLEERLKTKKSSKIKKSANKKRMMNRLTVSEQDLEGERTVKLSEHTQTFGKSAALEKVSTMVPAMEANTKYVAPHLRSYSGKELEEHLHFRKRVRGLLNRLSESNVESITTEMSTIFRTVGRSDASRIIGEEVLASCSGGPRGNEQYAAVFAAFVAGLSCMVGIDFSAKLLASLAKSFEDEYLKEDNLSLRNLTLLLSYFCIYKVCSSDLVYDFLIMLSKRLMETDVSTILTILQCCGMKLRGDDPAAMKDFIISIRNRVNELKGSYGLANINSKRMEFMLETICEIKNNKKRLKEEPIQHVRVKKWLEKLKFEDIVIRGLTWSKLLDPGKKGQWWLSGNSASNADNVEEVANIIDGEVLEAQQMLQLAVEQRMNTDARKGIFCVVMGSEDYIDAFEKLLRLDLPGKQDREIMRVLLECCLREKVFNKYYTALASKLCNHGKNHKLSLQCCLLDHLKEVESMDLRRSLHLARFIAEILASFSLSISFLKHIDLTDPKQSTPKRIMHFRMLFEALFEYPDNLIWNIFTRIAVALELENFRDSLEFFIKEYVVEANNTLANKFKVVKKAFRNVEGILM